MDISKNQNIYFLDSATIAMSTVTFSADQIAINDIPFELKNSHILFKSTAFLDKYHGKKLLVSYRNLPFDLSSHYQHLDRSLLKEKDAVIYIGYDNTPTLSKNNALITETGIDYDGSFARGFSLGNGQSLLLNSNFNMQLAGDLGDGIKVKAAISDDNIPIQPEGNTQLLQEFDRVFIEVSKNNTSIIAGDYELKRPKSYFMNYSKQLKGMSVFNQTEISPTRQLRNRASFAVSRAQFTRYNLPTLEGNQGPYKLIGGNGERFIIIESGSEKIYEDGRLLTRGQEHDYIISYDQAEIIFTDKKLITKDSRIIAEYEYVDRSYLRSLYALESNYTSKKIDVDFNFYNLQDSKNVTGDVPLDEEDLSILAASGDNTALARRSGIRLFTGEFNNTQILYALLPGNILQYSTDPDSAKYVAAFSEVMAGTGSYVIDSQVNANGRVYKYVGEGNGSYIPEIQLIAPKKSQIMALGAKFRPTDKTRIVGELSLSNEDLNRLSKLDKQNDNGLASFFAVSHDFSIGDSIPLIFTPYVEVELTQKNFQSLNPYRATEFVRDWNIDQAIDSDESIIRSGIKLKRNRKLDLDYNFSRFTQTSFYSGNKHTIDAQLNFLGWQFLTKSSLLLSQNQLEESTFFRPKAELRRSLFNNWQLSLGFERERNKKTESLSGLINPNSLSYTIYSGGISRTINKGWEINMGYKYRYDQGILSNDFTKFSVAEDLSIGTKWKHGKGGNLHINMVRRDLDITNSQLTLLSPKKSILGQAEYQNKFWNGAVSTLTTYNIGSGQQAKVEYDYQEVLPGEGNFDWVDFNDDGIQQSGEFRVSTFPDTSRYIQVALFNNEFIQTNNASINQSLRLDPKLLFRSNKKSKRGFAIRALQRLSTNSNIRIAKKVSAEDDGYNPFNFSSKDTTIVNYLASNNHTLFINRGNPVFDWQLFYQSTASNIIQISGFEKRDNVKLSSRTRATIKSKTDVILDIEKGAKNGDSEVFAERDFMIDFYSISPQINYRPYNNLRFIFTYVTKKLEQQIGNQESATNNEISFSSSLRQVSKTTWNMGFRFVNVAYQGDSNSYVAFELLEDLKPGKNYIWNTDFTKRLSGNVDLIINYEGRKSGDNKTIHTARAQVKATF